jgi:electron transfer flavoprotein beta subunit
MNIVVPIKQVPNLIDDLEINSSGNGLDGDSLTFVLNEFDEQAIEQAVLVKEASGGTVTVVGVDTTEELDGALHTALAKGADSVAKIQHDFEPGLASHVQAKLLADAIKGMAADLILTGVQAADDLDGNLGPMIAAHLGVPYVGIVSGVTVSGGTATIHKEYAGGVMAEFEAVLPVVIGVQAASKPPRYAPISLVRQKAKEAQVAELAADASGVSAGIEVKKMYKPQASGHAAMLDGDAKTVAQKIRDLIAERGLL